MLVDKPNLLVADDDANTRSHLSHFLSSRGYNVQCFDSGVHLLAHLASAQPPSLLILDVRMPPAGGLEVLAGKAWPAHPGYRTFGRQPDSHRREGDEAGRYRLSPEAA